MLQDAQGHPLTGATREAVPHYDAAVRAYGLGYGDALSLFETARQAAPTFAMAHIGKAWLLALANDAALAVSARTLIDMARALPLNEREQAHLAAVSHAAEGRRASGVAILDRHLMTYPRDILAHFAAMLMDGFLGRFPLVAGRSARAMARWSTSDPGYGILLAFYGFGLEEAADYGRAEAISRTAAELEPYSYWPHHAVSHVMEMNGRPDEGLAWMDTREPLWSTEQHTARTHVWWHKALFHVELGQYDAALAIYDGPVVGTQRPIGISLTNASALLWRLEMLGCQAGERWQKEAEHWRDSADGRICVFTDIHAAMAELGAGDHAAVDARLTAMHATAADGDERAVIYRDIGIPVVQGLAAFRRGAYAEAVDNLLPARFDLWKMGGSKAQRDVVEWTLTEAAARAGLRDVALSLAHERLAARPESAPNRRFLEQASAIAD